MNVNVKDLKPGDRLVKYYSTVKKVTPTGSQVKVEFTAGFVVSFDPTEEVEVKEEPCQENSM